MKTSYGAIGFAIVGMAFMASPVLASDVEFRLVAECVQGLQHYPSPFSDGKTLCVSSSAIITDANIVQVKPGHNKVSGTIEFEFDVTGQSKLASATEGHVGGQIALISEGKLVTAAVILSPLKARTLEMTLPDKGRELVLRVFQDRKLVK
jgi:preprotein translocase subunit SecD